jgi:hypothetical protein
VRSLFKSGNSSVSSSWRWARCARSDAGRGLGSGHRPADRGTQARFASCVKRAVAASPLVRVEEVACDESADSRTGTIERVHRSLADRGRDARRRYRASRPYRRERCLAVGAERPFCDASRLRPHRIDGRRRSRGHWIRRLHRAVPDAFFRQRGQHGRETLSFVDGVWMWQGSRVRCRGVFSDDGRTLTARHERSHDGEHWRPSMTVTLRRID